MLTFSVLQCNLTQYQGHFDIGVSLHACGLATDLVIDQCLRSEASMVVSPCCYGTVHSTSAIQLPRSKEFSLHLNEQVRHWYECGSSHIVSEGNLVGIFVLRLLCTRSLVVKQLDLSQSFCIQVPRWHTGYCSSSWCLFSKLWQPLIFWPSKLASLNFNC